ncbi:MAG: hypothetical protein H8E35_04830 [Ardenticatenia bacterium]|nr:hypothetical protein [Ardenticatenia bacterium]
MIRGNLLVIPLENSLIYVEPLYLQAETGQIPELKRVILASGERIVMSETLAEGLVSLFGKGAAGAVDVETERPVVGTGDVDILTGDAAQQIYDLAHQAEEHYTAAQAALQNGDWATYGAELDAMEVVLQELVEIAGLLEGAAE